MSKSVNEAVRSLERARESAKQRLGEIEAEREELKASLKSLDLALRAVTKNRATNASVGRPAATTEEVKRLALELIVEQGPLPVASLEEIIGKRLAALGKSRSGLKLRLTQALRDERFERTQQGVRLRSVPNSTQTAADTGRS